MPIRAFTSFNGGSTWTNATTAATVSTFTVRGSLRSGPLPSAEIDAVGKMYVVWQDCRFRASGGSCTSRRSGNQRPVMAGNAVARNTARSYDVPVTGHRRECHVGCGSGQ
jgi:hypothetical protein